MDIICKLMTLQPRIWWLILIPQMESVLNGRKQNARS